jgi:CheY-like chemotaxis protein/signal transduction histidine kinase
MSKELEARIEQLSTENRRLRDEVAVKSRTLARALANYQQRALHMDVIRQQNEELDRLAQELAKAKKLEEERGKELAAAHQIKSDFLASFSHEIRTPLNGILGYCDLLAREEGTRLTRNGQRDLSVIRSNAKTLLSLINDILDLSKIEAGRVDVVKELVEVDALLEECRATAQDYLKGKNATLNMTIAPDARRAYTDGLKLRQIALNLMSNAAKFTQEGEINVHVYTEEDTLVLRVADTGVGIPPDQIKHLFERFRRVNDKAHRKVGGTGLGLAIVRELSKLLGGTTTVESTVGRGSTFAVTMPGAIDRALLTPSVPPIPGGVKNPSMPAEAPLVLLIDDDMMIQYMVGGRLEEEGFRVVIGIDGEDGLKLAKQHHPNVVLLDVDLPKLDGWGVLAELKSNPELAPIPVVMLSAEESRGRAFSLGASDYLVKPVEPHIIAEVCRREVAGGAGDVIVADDDPGTREIVCRQLRHAGLSTTQASDGEEVLALVRERQPSLLILDLMLPHMDGFDTLRHIREEGSTVPVIVLTGKELTAPEEEMLRDGLARVVTKGGLALEQVVQEAKRLILQHRAPSTARMPRVLYVEDAQQNRDIVRRYLRGEFEVFEAEDGVEGVERALQEMPDLILMDLSLPRMDGWEATRVIKGNAKLRHIPVIALTAHVGKEDHDRAMQAGCDEFLTKPVERNLLLGAVRRQLAKRTTNV